MCLFSDIDECSEGIVMIGGSGGGAGGDHDLWCEQHCNNTVGGYNCSCNPGYSIISSIGIGYF